MFCEICGKKADVHHIVHRNEGGLDFDFNFKYLCPTHHRGKFGPHKNKIIDFKYKLELKNKLYTTLSKEFYSLNDIISILKLSNSSSKKLKKVLKRYKEGYKTEDLISFLLLGQDYSSELLEDLIIETSILKNK